MLWSEESRYLQAVQQHGGGRLLHGRLLIGPGAPRRAGLVPAGVGRHGGGSSWEEVQAEAGP